MVSPTGKPALVKKLLAISEPSPAIARNVESCMKKEFCTAVVKKASMITPIKAETIAPPRTTVEKFLNR